MFSVVFTKTLARIGRRIWHTPTKKYNTSFSPSYILTSSGSFVKHKDSFRDSLKKLSIRIHNKKKKCMQQTFVQIKLIHYYFVYLLCTLCVHCTCTLYTSIYILFSNSCETANNRYNENGIYSVIDDTTVIMLFFMRIGETRESLLYFLYTIRIVRNTRNSIWNFVHFEMVTFCFVRSAMVPR